MHEGKNFVEIYYIVQHVQLNSQTMKFYVGCYQSP